MDIFSHCVVVLTTRNKMETIPQSGGETIREKWTGCTVILVNITHQNGTKGSGVIGESIIYGDGLGNTRSKDKNNRINSLDVPQEKETEKPLTKQENKSRERTFYGCDSIRLR